MTGGIVATSIVFFPAAPFFLLMHGKDVPPNRSGSRL